MLKNLSESIPDQILRAIKQNGLRLKVILSPAAIVTIVLLSILLSYHQTQLIAQRHFNSDEASSILASQGVAKTGLPMMPSGNIYYRSLVAHYLNGLSILVLGDNPLGWSGASVFFYFFLLCIAGIFLVSEQRPLLGIFIVLLLGQNPLISQIAHSPRMYMTYCFFVTMCHLWVVVKKPKRFDYSGYIYLILVILTALSHQHFIVMVPGLIVGSIVFHQVSEIDDIKGFILCPLVIVPIVGGLTAIAIHSVEHYLPFAWQNYASVRISAGNRASFSYPFQVVFQNSFKITGVFFFIWVLSWTYLRISKGLIFFSLAWLISALCIGATLPHQLPYYVAPAIPLFLMMLVHITTGESVFQFSNAKKATAIFLLFIVFSISWKMHFEKYRGIAYLFEEIIPSEEMHQWKSLKEWVNVSNALVLSSDPEIFFLQTGIKIDYEPREVGISSKKCEFSLEDQFGHPYIHSICLMERVLSKSKRPVIFIGTRLYGTVGDQLSHYIDTHFKRLSNIDNQKLYCLSPDKAICESLAKTL